MQIPVPWCWENLYWTELWHTVASLPLIGSVAGCSVAVVKYEYVSITRVLLLLFLSNSAVALFTSYFFSCQAHIQSTVTSCPGAAPRPQIFSKYEKNYFCLKTFCTQSFALLINDCHEVNASAGGAPGPRCGSQSMWAERKTERSGAG